MAFMVVRVARSCLFVAAFFYFAYCLFPVASHADLSESRRTAIVSAVQAVMPATVTIGAEKVAMREVSPFRSLHDDFFSDWFSDPFFGGLQEAVRVRSLGSGIIVGDRGLVLTNDHVVAGAEEIRVTLSDGRVFPARLVGRGLPVDLDLLQIILPDDFSEKLPFVTLGTATDLALGEWAVAIGAPSNLEASVTAGVISATGRRLPSKEDYRYLGMIQTDAAINPGNSGGPLVNADGKVVGINTAIVSKSGGSEGLGFAIPADQARKVMDDVLAKGEIRGAWFGWELVESKSGGRAGTPVAGGLVVQSVNESGEAASAGIRAGAVIKSMNGLPIRDVRDYEQVLMSVRIGQIVAVRFAADGVEQVAKLTAREMPESLLRVDLGLEVDDMSVRYSRLYGAGVVVRAVNPAGVFGKMQSSPVQPGDVIISINGRGIQTVSDYENAERRLKKNSIVEIVLRRRNVVLTFTIRL